jgi:hypothetical protein
VYIRNGNEHFSTWPKCASNSRQNVDRPVEMLKYVGQSDRLVPCKRDLEVRDVTLQDVQTLRFCGSH